MILLDRSLLIIPASPVFFEIEMNCNTISVIIGIVKGRRPSAYGE